jgi:regulator of RNase E activity RraA
MVIAGPACTVKVYPGDNLMVHKSLDVAQPGDVIVIDAGGSRMNAVLGDLVATKAKYRGIAAFIVDGYIRDLPGIVEAGMPVFAKGITPIGPLHRGPGEINYPIQCGGIVVNPGDIICGDVNGVVVVPQEIAATLLTRLEAKREGEAEYCAAVKRGDFSNAWVDAFLLQNGCEMENEETVGSKNGR